MTFESFAHELCDRAHAEGRNTLLEPELYDLLKAGGVETPAFFTVPASDPDGAELRRLPGTRAVVKVVSPRITHKTEMGGVKVVDNTPEAIRSGIRTVLANVRERGGDALAETVREVLVSEFVAGDDSLGGQLFAGLRFSPDMGPVLALGFGGLEAEELAVRFVPGQGTVLASPVLSSPEEILAKFQGSFVWRKLAGKTREARLRADDATILKVIRFFHGLATRFSNRPEHGYVVQDFEINPFFVTDRRLVAVDAFMRFKPGLETERSVPLDQVATLLEPKTVAVMGVSAQGVNPGRVILRNLLREQFPTGSIRVIRPDGEAVDGVAAARSISDLPWRADLVVVSVGAKQVPGVIEEALATGKAASMVLIPGGMGETEEGKAADRAVRQSLAKARAEGRFTPVLVGPNCLGLRSVPGRYDTLFIPQAKLPLPEGVVGNVALVSQSGAFMITRMSDLPQIAPRYAISTGNQMDLALVDFVEALLRDGKVDVFGLYIEGFGRLDGLRLARLVRQGRAAGKDFLVYKGGRTAEGLSATASHTASISGDWLSCVEVLKDAGALVATSFEEFNALFTMATLLRDKHVGGNRLGCLSNAGFETVGMADNVSEAPRYRLAEFSPDCCHRISEVLGKAGITALVNLHNPLDITPMAPDSVYADCLAAMVDDPAIDGVLVGIVPLTPTMKSLPPGVDPRGVDSVDAPGSLADLFPPIVARSTKPVITTLDSGKLYDPLVHALQRKGVPVFRSVDGAMRALQRYMEYRRGC